MEAYSLFELNEHIRRVIALNFQDPVWVRCEIAQVKVSRGHYYLDLVEKVPDQDEILAQVNGVIWAKTAWILQRKLRQTFDEVLQDGMEVRLKVRVDYHERFGLKLMVDDLDPSFTLGNIEARRREIIEALQSQGMIGRNAKIPLPVVVQRIAVLSAHHAAGYQDFRKHLLHYPAQYRFWVDLYPIAVQGALVEGQLIAALHQIAHAKHHYDCVAIVRGGGSRVDLSAFDSFNIGKTIAEFPLPILTGIGHEVDHTVADAVAHTSLKTPTAVADFILEVNTIFENTVDQVYRHILEIGQQALTERRTAVRHLTELLQRAPRAALLRNQLLLDQMVPALQDHARRLLQVHHDKLEHSNALLSSLDPVSVLQRGFSITTHDSARLVNTAGLSNGDMITTHLYEGKIESKVLEHE